MGDPFSVAGTAVGITSLGIQLCQILSRYYSQYRGIHDEINDVVDRADVLEAYLKSLARVKQKIETDDIALSAELQKALKACEDVLARLKEMAKRCGETKAPDSFADRMRMAQKRLLWPFKRDNLMDLQTTLDRFQSNLGLALQLLGLDYEADQLRTLVAETKEIHREINDMSTAQIAQATQLNTSMSDLSNQLALAHITASNGFNAVSAAQKSHTTLVQAGFDDLSNQYEHLVKQSAAMQQILEKLVPATSTSHSTGTLCLPNIVTNEQAAETLRTSFNRSLRQYNADIPRNRNRNMPELMSCLCRSAATEKMSTRVGKWIAFYSESAYEHTPGCPYFSHSDFSKNVGLRFTMCNFMIRKCVHAGFQQSRVQGWSTISPFLRYRAVVPSNSGIFKIIADAQKIVWEWNNGSDTVHQKETKEILPKLTNDMRICLGTNAHPTDIDEYGISILEKIMFLLWDLFMVCRIENQAIVSTFLDACQALGIFCNDTDDGAVLIWQYFAAKFPTNVTFEIFRCLARRLRTWRLDHVFLSDPGATEFFCSVSKVLMIEEFSSGFLEKDSLHGALLRRSETDFQSCIHTSNSKYLTSVLTDYEHAGILGLWTEGLKILISSGIVDDIPQVQTTLWISASSSQNVESLQVLIDSQWRTSLWDWFSLNFWISQGYQRKYSKFPQWSDAKRYRPIFRSLVTKLSKQSELDRGTKVRSEESLPISKEIPFYHTPHLHITTAEDLWNTGHRCIDTTHPEADYRRTNETPLWMIASQIYLDCGSNAHWPVASWLIEKGANAFWSHPVLLTTPAHVLARSSIKSAMVHQTIEDLKLTSDLLSSSEIDRCSCYCSLSGCYVISCAFLEHPSRIQLKPWEEIMRAPMLDFWNKRCLPWLFSILDREEYPKEMVLAMIRLLTFEELSLTHTCCIQIQRVAHEILGYAPFPLEENEIEEIYEAEKKDMILLDELMEEFEMEWHNHGDSFTSFIKQVWKPRMEAFRTEQKGLNEIYQETGIKLTVSEPDSSELRFWEISDGSENEEEENYDVNSDIEEE